MYLSLNSIDLGFVRPCRHNAESFDSKESSASYQTTRFRKESYVFYRMPKPEGYEAFGGVELGTVGSHAPVFRTRSSASRDITLAKPPLLSTLPTSSASVQPSMAAIFRKTPSHRLEKPHRCPKPLPAVRERENKTTPEALSLTRCFSPLLFKARSR